MDSEEKQYEWKRVDEAGVMGVNFLREGKTTLVKVAGKSICLVRKQDKLYAVRDRCPHGNGPLHQGTLNEEGDLVCPWHKFRFCVENGRSAGGEGYFVPTYPIEIREDGVYIGIEKRKKLFGLF